MPAAQGAYTATGSISTLSGRQMTYNAAGRLSKVTSGGQPVADYSYDAAGRRVSKTVGAATTLFTYDEQGVLLEENSTKTTDYICLDNGRLIATYTAGSGSLTYVHSDHLGTPQAVTDAVGAAVWKFSAKPFGEGNPTGSATLNHRFPGQYADAETGFHQNGFRDYVPSLGRYLESDLIGIGGGLNTYVYAESNPLKFSDESGLTWWQTIKMTWYWAAGVQPDEQWFGANTKQTRDMRDAPGVQKAINYWSEKNKNCPIDKQVPVTNYGVHFGIRGLYNAGTDPTEQFVESYTVNIYPDHKGNIIVVVSNTTSLTSFLYGMWPNAWNTSGGSPFGNYTQYYKWTQIAP